jgi:hypothetical protein
MRTTAGALRRFVAESNLIEGIKEIRTGEIKAAQEFLEAELPSISELQKFVGICAPGEVLRDRKGLDVRVGGHVPPPGGPDIRNKLTALLYKVNSLEYGPYEIHIEYENLHPFTDCNGRSGRILWAWQMVNQNDRFNLSLGFLHAWYYQTLSHSR